MSETRVERMVYVRLYCFSAEKVRVYICMYMYRDRWEGNSVSSVQVLVIGESDSSGGSERSSERCRSSDGSERDHE